MGYRGRQAEGMRRTRCFAASEVFCAVPFANRCLGADAVPYMRLTPGEDAEVSEEPPILLSVIYV